MISTCLALFVNIQRVRTLCSLNVNSWRFVHLKRNQPFLGQKSIDDKFTITFLICHFRTIIFPRTKHRNFVCAAFCVWKREKTNKKRKKLVKENIQKKIFTRINYFLSGDYSVAGAIKRSANYSRDIVLWSSPHLSSCVLIPSICSPFFCAFIFVKIYRKKSFFFFFLFKKKKDWKEKENRVFSRRFKLIFHLFFSFLQKLWQRPVRKCNRKEIKSLKRQPQKVRDALEMIWNFSKVSNLKLFLLKLSQNQQCNRNRKFHLLQNSSNSIVRTHCQSEY